MLETLDEKIMWTFNVFDSLDLNTSYQIAFSGGKDSHVLLGMYIEWLKSRKKPLNIKVVFADTLLETQTIYSLIVHIEQICNKLGIQCIRTVPDLKKSFWVLLFGLGYPVPDYKNRWCTSYLKIKPINKIEGTVITGTHLGESSSRDRRLTSCGSTECGIDKLTNTIEPLAIWRNCDIWDWIFLYSDKTLYDGVSSSLITTYNIAESSNGSMRMGCFLCPVISIKTLQKQVEQNITTDIALQVRNLLEELRNKPRIVSFKTQKSGAILVDARREVWEKLKPLFPELLSNNWITNYEIELISNMIEKRTYPPTYKQEWIDFQEKLLKAD